MKNATMKKATYTPEELDLFELSPKDNFADYAPSEYFAVVNGSLAAGKMKDYIALPKPNGYQSLHTTIFALGGKRIEIQIRTPQMNEAAEFGIAAHWRYKNKSEQSEKTLSKTFQWVEKLQEWKKDMVNSEDFIDSLKIDVFGDRIFVFTPKGDVIDLPSGATPVDFAYTIHSDVGDKCAGARVHGKMVALNTELHNGDIVEIITTKSKTPSQTWLSFVKTSHTRTHIKHWFRKQGEEKNIENGLSMINDELKALEGKTWAQIDESKKEKTIQKLKHRICCCSFFGYRRRRAGARMGGTA